MTSRTGNRRSSRGAASSSRAFTLIELMLVMTLLTIVVAIAAPSLGNFFRGRNLDSEARRVLALTRHGQSRAVFEGVPMVLWLDPKQRAYGLQAEPGFEDRDPRQVRFELDRDLSVEVANAVIVPRSNAGFSRGPGLASTAPQNALRDPSLVNLPQIRFLPDGSVDDASLQGVHLLDRDGNGMWVALSRNRMKYEIRSQLSQPAGTYP